MALKRLLIALALLLAPTFARCQCELPAGVFRHEDNMLSPEREMDLGDAMSEQMEKRLTPIADPDLNAYINRMGEKLLAQLPPSGIHYRFLLIDEPYANAFGIAGGRIYVTRKVALSVQSEDELAGLLAHEIGHIYTHQIAIAFTRSFRDIGVNLLTSRAEVFHAYHQLLDTWRLKKYKADPKRGQEGQSSADIIAIYAMSRAGYNPQSFADFFDRLTENRGKTGNFLSDLFGTTTEASRRFKAMLATTTALPASCIDPKHPSSGDLLTWKQKLLEWSGGERVESVHDVVLRKRLEPPLESDIAWLKFSPDGNYIVAQDDASINVLTRTPFASLFRLDAPEGALAAMFTPDSKNLVVPSRGRVEIWNLIDRKRVSVHEISELHRCIQQSVSYDGRYLGCYRSDYGLDLFDLETGEKILERKNFSQPSTARVTSANGMLRITGFSGIQMGFSPDGRYFAAAGHDAVCALELATRNTVRLGGGLADTRGWFDFEENGRIIIFDPFKNGGEAQIREFPSGKVLQSLRVGNSMPSAVTKGNYIEVRPIQDHPVGLLDVSSNKLILGSRSVAIDVYDKTYITENRAGMLVMADITPAGPANTKSVILPRAELRSPNALAISDDLSWLALSEHSRGALFDLHTGSRELHVRSFFGAWFPGNGKLMADFPKFEKSERALNSLDLQSKEFTEVRKIDDNTATVDVGPYVVVWRAEEKHPEQVTLEVHDTNDGHLLWSRKLEGGHFSSNWIAGTGVITWQASSAAAERAAAANPSIRQKLDAVADKRQSFYMEVLDIKTGQKIGSLVVDTGKSSFAVRYIRATPTQVAIADNDDRIRVYSLEDGSQSGAIFADKFDISRGGLLAVGAGDNRVQVYDADTLEQVDQYSFAEPITIAMFLPDGHRLLVITRDQTVFVLDPRREPADLQTAAN